MYTYPPRSPGGKVNTPETLTTGPPVEPEKLKTMGVVGITRLPTDKKKTERE